MRDTWDFTDKRIKDNKSKKSNNSSVKSQVSNGTVIDLRDKVEKKVSGDLNKSKQSSNGKQRRDVEDMNIVKAILKLIWNVIKFAGKLVLGLIEVILLLPKLLIFGGGRRELHQFSPWWIMRTIGHAILPMFVDAPKTERSTNYSALFFNNNPGIFGHIYFCPYCLKKRLYRNPKRWQTGMQIDHIIPLNKGGINWSANLICACPKCNNKKRAKTGLWVVRGYIGKFVFSILQTVSNLYSAPFWSRNPIKIVLSTITWGVTIYVVYKFGFLPYISSGLSSIVEAIGGLI